MSEFPKTMSLGGGKTRVSLRLSETCSAILRGSSEPRADARISFTAERIDIVVKTIEESRAEDPDREVGPVYESEVGTLYVPTGRIILLTEPGTKPKSLVAAVREAGYEAGPGGITDDSLMLAAASKETGFALRGLESLRTMQGVAEAEAEMLTRRRTEPVQSPLLRRR